MLATLPEASPWSRWLGPVYVTSQLVDRLGISRQALDDRRRRGTILALKTVDGHWVYPASQFDERGAVLKGLQPVLACFRGVEVDAWSLAGCLTSPQEALDGQSVLESLRHERSTETVLELARDAAQRFAR